MATNASLRLRRSIKNQPRESQRKATIGNAERPCHPDALVAKIMINIADVAEV